MFSTAACLLLALVPPAPTSRITAITVYPDRAEITREITARAEAGAHEMLVDMLPSEMDDGSLRVSARSVATGMSLGGIEVRVIPSLDVRGPELMTAEADLSVLQQQAAALDDRLARIAKLRELLSSLQSASATQFAREMARAELAPQTWQGAYDFLKRNLDDLSEEERATKLERGALGERISVAASLVSQLQARRTRAHKQLAVSIDSPVEAEVTLSLSYAQPGASWAPSYEAVMDPATGQVSLAMHAWVKQTTGEAWQGVRLTLATGAPALGIDLPRLTSLALARRNVKTGSYNAEYIEGLPIIGHNYQDILKQGPGVTDSDGDGHPNVHGALEVLTAGASAEHSRADGGFANIVQTLASFAQADTVMTFEVPGPVSLNPDGQPRRMKVSQITLAGRREYLVIPSVKPAAFLLARVTSPADHPLLAGEVKHYVGATLVGSSRLAAVAPGEEFSLSFGADDRVKVDVPSLPRSTTEKGGSRSTVYDRRVALTNRTGQPIDVKVQDRVPVSTDGVIKVSVSESTTDGFEVKDTEPGIYTWNLSLEADTKREIVLSYTVRHPVGLALASLR